MGKKSKLTKDQALPIRCNYLDTTLLYQRLIEIYGSDKNFELQRSNDRYILWSAKKLTKEQLQQLHAVRTDPTIYPHYSVPGDHYYVGTSEETHS